VTTAHSSVDDVFLSSNTHTTKHTTVFGQHTG